MAGILRVYRSPGGWRPRLATLLVRLSQSSAQVGKIRPHEKLSIVEGVNVGAVLRVNSQLRSLGCDARVAPCKW